MYGSTSIALANGTYIPASNIREGMKVLSYNPSTGAVSPSTVTYVFSLYANNTYIFNNALKVDALEVMYINGTWTRAYQAKVGDTLYSPLNNTYVKITNITVLHSGGMVYDFLAAPTNNFIGNGYLIDRLTSSGFSGCSVSGIDTAQLANGSIIDVGSLTLGDVVEGYNNLTRQVVPTAVVSIEGTVVHQEYIINSNLTLDANEVLMLNGRMQSAANITVGSELFNPETGSNVRVNTLDVISGNFTVYDVNTAPADNYIVNGYLIT